MTDFDVFGYVHIPHMVDATALAVLRDELDRVVAEQQPGDHAWTGSYLADYEAPDGGFKLTTIGSLERASALWKDTAQRWVPFASDLLGQPAKLHTIMGLIKPPSVGQPFPLHQDAIYYGPKDGRYAILTLYLDDVTEDNGAIRIVPGSHTHKWDHTGAGKKHIPSDRYTMQDTICVPAKAGDGLWMHLWMVHGSLPNTSDQPRRTARIGYVRV